MTRMKWLTWTENWIKKVFLKMCDMAKSGFETLSLTMILIFNLFFIVFLLLAVCTVLVLTGVDGGFIYHDGRIGIWGALCFIYAVCSLIAVSMVVMIRMTFIHPLQRNIAAMKELANGNFAVRVEHAEHGYTPREMVEFEQSSTRQQRSWAALRSCGRILSTTSPMNSKRPSSASAALPTCCWKSSCRPRTRRNT